MVKLFNRNKTLVIFLKRGYKYFFIFGILILMLIPLLLKSYSLAKQLTIEKINLKLKEGITSFEEQIFKNQEISNLIKQQDSFRRIFFIKGFPTSEYYFDIKTVQAELKSISITQDMLSNVFILFKDNPIFISNHIMADNYADVYPKFLNYKDVTFNQLRNELFEGDFSIKFLPVKKIYSQYYNQDYFDGVSCLINSSFANFFDQKSILTCVFDKKDIMNKILYEDQQKDCFAYLTDVENNIIVSHNFFGNKTLKDVKNGKEITFLTKKFVTITHKSDKLGLNVVIGINSETFQRNINSILELVLVYAIIGSILILIASLLFITKETLWIKRLVDVASGSAKTIFNNSNEYQYINNAITKINSLNEEQLSKIDELNNSTKISLIKNLLTLGIYTEKEQNELKDYFNNNFDFYCIAKINYNIDNNIQMDKLILQNTILEIENALKSSITNKCIVFNILPQESIFMILFKDKDLCDIKIIDNELTAAIRGTTADMKIPVTINVGLSNIVCDIKNAKLAYQQAKYAVSVNENRFSSGVYEYRPLVSNVSVKKTFDAAILVKLFDAIIAGEKNIVSQIFSNSLKELTSYLISEQEQLQIFFSFRQAVYNSYIMIIDNNYENAQEFKELALPEYNAASDLIRSFNELNQISIRLCQIVMDSKNSNNDKLKVDIIEYINRKYGDLMLSASSIASEFLISEKYVFNFVKEQTGKSLGKFIEDVRVSKAEQLLMETDHSNSQILQMCGFGSENTFYRAFSKKHSVSPTIWRSTKKI